VIREGPGATDGYRFLLGSAAPGATKYDFCAGATRQIWSSTYANAFVLGGTTRVNGVVVDGTTTNRPTAFSVISLVASAASTGLSADAFSRDRTNDDRSWFGDLAELIIYDQRLSDAERQQVETYLMTKYGIQ
jgi:hypothetical protein